MMEDQNPTFSFELDYAGEKVRCRVNMQAQSCEILFDGRFIATIALTGDATWIQESGVTLPDSIIEEIGLRVESEYL
ncbi:hypothetical protein MTO98_30485 [Mucilaginibacter sp. SMC90]|uniref:hypothetical protein n=1 Tax=Mucilaginibacter sp. SMC90 TaxID=2929803 RepID=UPI001FB335EF|nr:hypothetical protein [Mucilaginibacter sp. SMC90]UOE48730.1 hypothetical protein MTO98_30485 [Mucilaginibacter sp. SMC90]